MDGVPRHYDICIVGAGMIGSAAAYHVTKLDGSLDSLLIGPSEKNRNETDIHGAHYDAGRIYHDLSSDSIWAKINKRAIDRYSHIEEQSGIKFHTESGYLEIGYHGGSLIDSTTKTAKEVGLSYSVLDIKDLKNKYPYFHFDENNEAVYSESSGHIDPRLLLKAQMKLAIRNGCQYVDDIVCSIKSDNGTNLITTDTGRTFQAKKILLATGAFTFCRDLLPKDKYPAMEYKPETVILIAVNEYEEKCLKQMPNMYYQGKEEYGKSIWFESYILPPIKYPDGKTYLKVGHGKTNPTDLYTPEEINKWYQTHEDLDVMDHHMLALAKKYFPGLKFDDYKFDYCVTTHTKSGYPYIDMMQPTIGVALGGCGGAAGPSNEWGKIAAKMIVNKDWDYDIPKKHFKYQVQSM